MHNKKISVRIKIILITCGMTLFASLLIGAFSYFRIANLTIHTSINGLAGETRLMALRFKESYDEMGNDVAIVYHTPPIGGIIRSQATGVDPKDGSTYALWKTRLESIFASIMEARPHYTQMRYIGVADRGRELVRVNRLSSGFEKVPTEKLQQKEAEPYFKEALKLKKGQLYFSEVTYNREKGRVEESFIPTVRAVVPVFMHDTLFGMIVINADYRILLERAFKEIAPKYNTFIVNHSGDYAEYRPSQKYMVFELHKNYSSPPPAFINTVKNSDADEQLFEAGEDGFITYFVKLTLDSYNRGAFLAIGLRASEVELLKGAHKTQIETLILALAITFFSLFIAIVTARKLTAPLQEMTYSITKADSGDLSELHLPIEMQDEIGDLARAFTNLASSLHKSEAKAHDVLNNVIDGIITIDGNGRVESINPACEVIFGYKAAEVVGKNIKILMPKPYHSQHDKYISNYNKTGKKKIIGVSREVVGRRKDGTEFPMELSVSEIKTADTHLFTGIVRDITERKQISIMKDEFISTVNHELRTPLTSIQTSLGLLRIDLEKTLNPEGKRILDLAYSNCERLAQLVNDILDIEKIAAGKMEYAMKEKEMVSFVQEIIDHNQGYASKYGVRFVLSSDFDAIFCKLDANRFTQALANLLSNAAKFSPEGEEVSVRLKPEGKDKLRLCVADNGPGIPESFKKKVFKKFAQADSSSTRSKGGTGLGLNITKSIIEAFGGKVTFDSIEGKGTVFHFVLPISKSKNTKRS